MNTITAIRQPLLSGAASGTLPYPSLGQLLSKKPATACLGREAELRMLGRLLDDDAAPVLFLYGLGGIGKSALLQTFAGQAGERGYKVARMDGAAIEPSTHGFCSALAAAAGMDDATAIAAALAARAQPTLIVLDHYEQINLLDGWLRQALLPSLPAHSRILIAGRHPPGSCWRLAPGWSRLAGSVELGRLSASSACAVLEQGGIPEHARPRLAQLAHGHPLALTLAVAAYRAHPEGGLPDSSISQVVDALVEACTAGIDAALRDVLRQVSLLRRITLPLLRHLLPRADAEQLFEQLAGLAIVTRTLDGLSMHAMVRSVIAGQYRSSDPAAYRRAQRAAAHFIQSEAVCAGRADSWRYTADLMYLVENPVIRAAHFSDRPSSHNVEQALPGDGAAVVAIAARHGGPQLAALVAQWWRLAPGCFHVTRSASVSVSGFYIAATLEELPAVLIEQDAMAAATLRHLQQDPLDANESWMLVRLLLSAEHGASMSAPTMLMCVDVKRFYVQHRLRLRRMYGVLDARSDFVAPFRQIGMQRLPDYDQALDGADCYLTLIDFGPQLMNGWLADLLAAESSAPEDSILALDEHSRQLLVDQRRLALTPLELKMMKYLFAHQGKALSRDTLLADVWGVHYESSSNVVDVVVRGLRKKMGLRASAIETITRFGYRFHLNQRQDS